MAFVSTVALLARRHVSTQPCSPSKVIPMLPTFPITSARRRGLLVYAPVCSESDHSDPASESFSALRSDGDLPRAVGLLAFKGAGLDVACEFK